MSLRFIDLFGGAGGWSLGLQLAGWDHVALYDNDPSACCTAERNLGGSIVCADLHHWRSLTFPSVDAIVGSPPCQGFSNEGYKLKNDPRNALVWDFLDIVQELKPEVWIFENVPGFRRLYKGEMYVRLVQRLQSMDYYWSSFSLDASDFGVPQYRTRFFVVGSKSFRPRAPLRVASEAASLFDARKVTLWDAIADLPQIDSGERVGLFAYDKPATEDYQRWAREGSKLVWNHTTQKHSQRVLEKIKSIPVGGDMTYLVGTYTENRVHYCGGYRRAVKDRPSYTAYWTRGMTSIHPDLHRFLSPRECARIQSFPDRYVFEGTTIENYKQVCNAVPPLLARAVGATVAEQMEGCLKEIESPLGYASPVEDRRPRCS